MCMGMCDDTMAVPLHTRRNALIQPGTRSHVSWAVTSAHLLISVVLLHTERQQPEEPHARHAKTVYNNTCCYDAKHI